jgi:hypothetical protein
MAGDMSYTINTPDVIAETIDGETILVNLTTGAYYSLEGSGSAIWDALLEGHAPEAVAEHLAHVYESPADELQAAVEGLVADLRAEQILVEAPSAHAPGPLAANGARAAFEPPKLKKFTDMQEIILLDPVHQVDDRGWPHPAPDADPVAGA